MISALLSPPVFALMFLSAAYKKGLFEGKGWWLLSLFIATLLLAVFTLFALIKLKKVSDLDITRREERYWFLSLLNCLVFGLLVILYLMQVKELLLQQVFIIWIILAISTVITFFYKISLHMTFAYTFLFLMNVLHGFSLWYLFVMIPLVYWSRFHLRKHTHGQLIAAVLLDSIVLFAVL